MNNVMTNHDLKTLAVKIVKNDFVRNPVLLKLINTNHPKLSCTFSINNRLSTTGGQTYETFNGQFHIQVGGFVINHYPKIILVDVIKHELCHYFLMAYNVKDKYGKRVYPHGKIFKTLLKSVHGIYAVDGALEDYTPNNKMYIFQCQKCRNYFCYTYKTANHDYMCDCGGNLTLIGKTSAKNYLNNFLYCQYTKPSANFKKIEKHLVKNLNKQKVA